MTALSNFFRGSGSGNWKSQTFTSTGTFTPIPGIEEYTVVLVGAGGGGGVNGYTGGRGGEICIRDINIPSGNTVAVAIGAGGAGATQAAVVEYPSQASTTGGDTTISINSVVVQKAYGGATSSLLVYPKNSCFSKHFFVNFHEMDYLAGSSIGPPSTESTQSKTYQNNYNLNGGYSWGPGGIYTTGSTTPAAGIFGGGGAAKYLAGYTTGSGAAGGNGLCIFYWQE